MTKAELEACLADQCHACKTTVCEAVHCNCARTCYRCEQTFCEDCVEVDINIDSAGVYLCTGCG